MRFVAMRPWCVSCWWFVVSMALVGLVACGTKGKATRKKGNEAGTRAGNEAGTRAGNEVDTRAGNQVDGRTGNKLRTMKQFAPLDTAVLANLSKTEIPGLQRDPGRPPQGGVLHVSYHSTDPAVPLKVDVLVRGCDNELCAPPELDQWKGKEKQLPHYRANMTKAFEEDPEKVMEVSVLEFGAHKAMAFYWFGFSRRHTHGVTMTSATNDLFAYYNAGDKALIMVTVVGRLPKGPGPKDLAGFKKIAPPRKLLEDAAVKSIEAFSKGL